MSWDTHVDSYTSSLITCSPYLTLYTSCIHCFHFILIFIFITDFNIYLLIFACKLVLFSAPCPSCPFATKTPLPSPKNTATARL